MEDRSLEFCDHLLCSVFRISGSRHPYRYQFPATSRVGQGHFHLCFGVPIAKIMAGYFGRVLFVVTHAPELWQKNEESFGRAVESLRAYTFPAEDQRFLLMVHVAMLAVVFVNSGKKRAGAWAYTIISRMARRCDLRNQRRLQLQSPYEY